MYPLTVADLQCVWSEGAHEDQQELSDVQEPTDSGVNNCRLEAFLLIHHSSTFSVLLLALSPSPLTFAFLSVPLHSPHLLLSSFVSFSFWSIFTHPLPPVSSLFIPLPSSSGCSYRCRAPGSECHCTASG